MKLRKSGPAFVPIIHHGKAFGVKFQSEEDAQSFLKVVQEVQVERWAMANMIPLIDSFILQTE